MYIICEAKYFVSNYISNGGFLPLFSKENGSLTIVTYVYDYEIVRL